MFVQNALIAETVKLQKFALRLTKNKSDADDLLQSTCLRALEKADYFEEGTNLFRWSSKIMFNIFVSGYRRKVKFETQFDPDSYLEKIVVAPVQHIRAELADVKRAMLKLSPAHRQIMDMVCIQEMPYEEVSKTLGIPVGTVRSRLSRAREALQAILNKPSKSATRRIPLWEQPVNTNIPVIPAYLAALSQKKKIFAKA